MQILQDKKHPCRYFEYVHVTFLNFADHVLKTVTHHDEIHSDCPCRLGVVLFL